MSRLHIKRVKELDAEKIEYKIEKATEILDRNIGFIQSCDNKTSIILTVIGVMMTIIFSSNGLNFVCKLISICINTITFGNCLYLACLFGAITIILVGIYSLGSVLVAITQLNTKKSRIYFSGISDYEKFQTYKMDFYSMNQQELLDELIVEIYINSYIATEKYRKYNLGIKLSAIGLLTFLLVLMIGQYVY